MTEQPSIFTTSPDYERGYRQALDDFKFTIATNPHNGPPAEAYRNGVDIEYAQNHRGEKTRVRWLEDRALELAREVAARTKAATNLAVIAARHARTHDQTRVDLASANAEIERLHRLIDTTMEEK